jgi:hypothetical protein
MAWRRYRDASLSLHLELVEVLGFISCPESDLEIRTETIVVTKFAAWAKYL